MKDLFLRYKFTDRGGNRVFDVYPADDHLTRLSLKGEVRLKTHGTDSDIEPPECTGNGTG